MPLPADFYIKRNDTASALQVQLLDATGTAVGLVGATVVFNLRSRASNRIFVSSGTVTVVDANQGKVKYSWASGDTKDEGTFDGEFVVTFADGTKQTFPNNASLTIVITDNIV